MSRVMLLKTKASRNFGPPCKSSSRRELKTDVLCSLFVITALRCYHERAVRRCGSTQIRRAQICSSSSCMCSNCRRCVQASANYLLLSADGYVDRAITSHAANIAGKWTRTQLPYLFCISYNSSAVAEMGDRGHNRHGPKRGGWCCAPFAELWEPV